MKRLLILLLFAFKTAFSQENIIDLNLKIDSSYFRTLGSNEIKYLKKEFGYQINSEDPKEEVFDITLTILNRSDKEIYFWMLTCSFEDNLVVNNNYIFIRPHNCDSNFPHLIKLDSQQEIDHHLTLTKSVKFDFPCENCIYGPQVEETKLGLILVDNIYETELDPFDYDLAFEDKSKWTIIWSNPIELLEEIK